MDEYVVIIMEQTLFPQPYDIPVRVYHYKDRLPSSSIIAELVRSEQEYRGYSDNKHFYPRCLLVSESVNPYFNPKNL